MGEKGCRCRYEIWGELCQGDSDWQQVSLGLVWVFGTKVSKLHPSSQTPYLPTVIELYHMIRVKSRKFFAQKGGFQEKGRGRRTRRRGRGRPDGAHQQDVPAQVTFSLILWASSLHLVLPPNLKKMGLCV